MKVNLGCGHNPIDGYINVDRIPLPGVDVVADLDDRDKVTLPFDDDSVDEFAAIDLVEHIVHPLPMFQELWRCAKPGAAFVTSMPYGSSDDAWEDPTHVRPWFMGSWRYLSQPIYYRADYGYTADWEVDRITLDVGDTGQSDEELFAQTMILRNVIDRQHVQLSAVKPARPRDPSLLRLPQVKFRRTGEG